MHKALGPSFRVVSIDRGFRSINGSCAKSLRRLSNRCQGSASIRIGLGTGIDFAGTTAPATMRHRQLDSDCARRLPLSTDFFTEVPVLGRPFLALAAQQGATLVDDSIRFDRQHDGPTGFTIRRRQQQSPIAHDGVTIMTARTSVSSFAIICMARPDFCFCRINTHSTCQFDEVVWGDYGKN